MTKRVTTTKVKTEDLISVNMTEKMVLGEQRKEQLRKVTEKEM